jgi:hypothetical protein
VHHDDPLEAKVALQFEQLLDRSLRRRIDAFFREWKRCRVAEYVHVATASPARDIEIDRGAPAGANRNPRPHRPRRARRGTHLTKHGASRKHRVPP